MDRANQLIPNRDNPLQRQFRAGHGCCHIRQVRLTQERVRAQAFAAATYRHHLLAAVLQEAVKAGQARTRTGGHGRAGVQGVTVGFNGGNGGKAHGIFPFLLLRGKNVDCFAQHVAAGFQRLKIGGIAALRFF